MTTTQKDIKATPLVPEVLTEEHHEALTRSWEMPAYEREAAPARRSDRSLVAGIVAGVVGLALGFGAGYLVRGGTVETAEPFVITSANGPVDANGQTLGRRVPAFDTALPIGITLGGPVDANGAPLGGRVAPFDTQPATELPAPVPVDANGRPLGDRVPPFETQPATELPAPVPVDANGRPLGDRVPAEL